MKRIRLGGYNSGMVNAVDPTQIPEGAVLYAGNLEYYDYTGLRKRKGTETHEISEIGIANIRAFAVWYPSHKITGMDSEKIYLLVSGTVLYLAYRHGRVFAVATVFTDIPSNADVRFYVGYTRVLICDGVNSGRFISVNKDGQLIYGDLGLDAPSYIPTISVVGSDNSFAEYDETDKGMTVERGNILQYCYTVEDKYGAESNPSPLATEQRLMYKYPDASSPTGFKYYQYKAKVGNLQTSQYPTEVSARLKYVNIYRRDIDHQDGTISKAFKLVYQLPVGTTEYIDTSAEDYGAISYAKSKAPASTDIAESNGIVFLSGIKEASIRFPFVFETILALDVRNDNPTDYTNAVIGLKLNFNEYGTSPSYIINNRDKVRLFYGDTTTPLPVLYYYVAPFIYLYVKLPSLDRNRTTRIYLCYGGTPSLPSHWNDFAYGKFCRYTTEYQYQQVFDANRVRSSNQIVNTFIPYDASLLSKASVPNLPNMLNTKVENGEWSHAASYNGYKIQVFGFDREIPLNDRGAIRINGVDISLDRPQIIYSLVNAPSKPLCGVISFRATPTDAAFDYLNATRIIRFGESSTVPYIARINLELDGTRNVLRFYNPVNSPIDLAVLPFYAVHAITLLFYWVGDSFSYIIKDDSSIGSFSSLLTVSVDSRNEITDTITLARPFTHGNTDIARAEIYQSCPTLTGDNIRKYLMQIYSCLPLALVNIGADTTLPIGQWVNNNVQITKITSSVENAMNQVRWSDISGNYFNSLDFHRIKEPVMAIVSAPSFLKEQYQNTIIIYGRNSISRLVLSNDLKSLAQSPDNIIPEFSSNGLYARESLVSAMATLFWLSETGVMAWNPSGMRNISKGIITIPIDSDAVGCYYLSNGQYWLYIPSTGDTYIYHIMNDAWTVFTGLTIRKTQNLNLGSDLNNDILLLDDSGMVYAYPSDNDTSVDTKIITKRHIIDNARLVRYRADYDISGTAQITARAVGQPNRTITSVSNNPSRMEWVLLPNGFWGEYVQFELDNIDKLTRLEIDIKEGV